VKTSSAFQGSVEEGRRKTPISSPFFLKFTTILPILRKLVPHLISNRYQLIENSASEIVVQRQQTWLLLRKLRQRLPRRLKEWLRRFHGVATKNLPNYLGWRRTLEALGQQATPDDLLLGAIGLGPYQQLTL
jgi:hypothetical protein